MILGYSRLFAGVYNWELATRSTGLQLENNTQWAGWNSYRY